MSAIEAKKEIQELVDQINHYNELYYQKNKSEISDYEFDQLLKKLGNLENEFPELKQPDSAFVGKYLLQRRAGRI